MGGGVRVTPMLICFGLGYSAQHFVEIFGRKVRPHRRHRAQCRARRSVERASLGKAEGAHLRRQLRRRRTCAGAIAEADAALVSVPPDENGDPVLRVCGDVLAHAQRLRAIVYLSTIGVYGDRGGAWVDEATPPQPGAARSRERLAAEQAWLDFGARRGIAVAILRLAGIYGPGQNALVQIARGNARRIVKPGQVFNRIHVGDIAQAIDAAFARRASGIFNVADDEPTPPADPIVFAAQLMGVEPPPEIPFEQAAPSMSPMALSFWQECRRVKNDKLKRDLGVSLRYPTYREGLRALFEEQ